MVYYTEWFYDAMWRLGLIGDPPGVRCRSARGLDGEKRLALPPKLRAATVVVSTEQAFAPQRSGMGDPLWTVLEQHLEPFLAEAVHGLRNWLPSSLSWTQKSARWMDQPASPQLAEGRDDDSTMKR